MQLDTYAELAEVLHLKPQSVKRNGDRSGHNYGINDKLPEPVVMELVSQYQQPAPKRTDKTIKAAKKIAKTLDNTTTVNVQINNVVSDKDDDNISDKAERQATTTKDNALTATKDKQRIETTTSNVVIPIWVIAIVLAPALVWQMEHYAAIVDSLSRIDSDSTLSYIFSWLFSFSVTGTAIVMTAAKGNRNYLYVFAIVETIANIIYCQPSGFVGWITTMLISFAMAFTILSYSEIFANTFSKENHHKN